MINYKKADAYFAKTITRENVMIYTPPAPDTGVWLASKHLAIYYPAFQGLPVDPSRCTEQPGMKRLIADAAKADAAITATAFTLRCAAKQYRVFSRSRFLRKDLVDILGEHLFVVADRHNLFVANDPEIGIIGFAAGFNAPVDIWKELENER